MIRGLWCLISDHAWMARSITYNAATRTDQWHYQCTRCGAHRDYNIVVETPATVDVAVTRC